MVYMSAYIGGGNNIETAGFHGLVEHSKTASYDFQNRNSVTVGVHGDRSDGRHLKR